MFHFYISFAASTLSPTHTLCDSASGSFFLLRSAQRSNDDKERHRGKKQFYVLVFDAESGFVETRWWSTLFLSLTFYALRYFSKLFLFMEIWMKQFRELNYIETLKIFLSFFKYFFLTNESNTWHDSEGSMNHVNIFYNFSGRRQIAEIILFYFRESLLVLFTKSRWH